jgi:hypothetical protein
MKKLFKFGFLALAISLSVAACSSNKTTETTVDSDSIRAAEAAMSDSMSVDTMGTDTTIAR